MIDAGQGKLLIRKLLARNVHPPLTERLKPSVGLPEVS
jgi:hypothetical protein